MRAHRVRTIEVGTGRLPRVRATRPLRVLAVTGRAPVVTGLLAQFLEFCTTLRIPSKDQGVIPLVPMASQRYLFAEIFAGLAEGIHDFVVLKARQLGASTGLWALDLFWLLKFPGMQGIYIADSDPNKEIHRDIITTMYRSLPPKYSRGLPRVSNRLQLAWHDVVDRESGRVAWTASRLMFSAANLRNKGELGRSRGVNYVHGTEMDSWDDTEGVAALTASLSDEHPQRLYVWEGTGQGYKLLYQMWEQAERSITSKQIFVAWWRRDDYRVTREAKALWAVYGAPRPTPDELEWGREVTRRYGVTVDREQLAWWRYRKAEGKGINGDESTMLQEYPWLPEHAFQAAGTEFLSATTMLRLRVSSERTDAPQGYRYDWGTTFDEKGDDVLVSVPLEAATLTVWQEPRPDAIYLVAGDPAYGSSAKADRFAATVWRCYPDSLEQVAEYCSPIGAMYTFAWVLAYLAGNYPRYLIHDVNGPGIAVLQELDRMANYGFGLRRRHGQLSDVVGAIQHYLWRRADALSGAYSREWKTGPGNQMQLMEKLRDAVERGALIVRSSALVTELAALRREGDRVEAGGVAHDDLAVTAALAVECWTEAVIPEIEDFVAPKQPPPGSPTHTTERLLRTFLSRVDRPADASPPVYGARTLGPGR